MCEIQTGHCILVQVLHVHEAGELVKTILHR